MINKVNKPSSEDWQNHSWDSRTKPTDAPKGDEFRKYERERPPPKKEEKRKESIFTHQKKEEPKAERGRSTPSPKKEVMEREIGKQEPKPKTPSGLGEAKKEATAGTETPENEIPTEEGFVELEAFETELEPQQEPVTTSKQPPTDQTTAKPAKQTAEMGALKEHPKTTETSSDKPIEKKEKSKEGKASSLEKGEEKGVTAPVNTPIEGRSFLTEKAQEAPAPTRSETIQQLATQIVDRIQVMRDQGQTSTIITLKQPPELAGATITLTSTDNAQKEFNISFANLSHDGKLLLEQKLQQDPLAKTLENKGIIVHQVTTSTEPEKLIPTETAGSQQGQPDEQQKEEQRKQQPFQMTEEEEE